MSASFQLTTIDDLPCVVRGPDSGPRLLVIQPLFEEMNRTRHLLAQITARLAENGIRSWMPDLPGTGDADGVPDWTQWQCRVTAFHAHLRSQEPDSIHMLAVRGGVLLTSDFPGRYLLAPVTSGVAILRDLLRTRAAAHPDSVTDRVEVLAARLKHETLGLAGYPISPGMGAALEQASSDVTGDHVAVVGEGGFLGPRVWRQADPADSRALADEIAGDVMSWIAACASR